MATRCLQRYAKGLRALKDPLRWLLFLNRWKAGEGLRLKGVCVYEIVCMRLCVCDCVYVIVCMCLCVCDCAYVTDCLRERADCCFYNLLSTIWTISLKHSFLFPKGQCSSFAVIDLTSEETTEVLYKYSSIDHKQIFFLAKLAWGRVTQQTDSSSAYCILTQQGKQ